MTLYTEYIYSNKKYEHTEKNVKALLFDVVLEEEKKVRQIREAIPEIKDATKRKSLLSYCDKQEENIRNIMHITNDMSELVKNIDITSNELVIDKQEELTDSMEITEKVKYEETKEPVKEDISKEEQIKANEEVAEEVKPKEKISKDPKTEDNDDAIVPINIAEEKEQPVEKAEEKVVEQTNVEVPAPAETKTETAPQEAAIPAVEVPAQPEKTEVPVPTETKAETAPQEAAIPAVEVPAQPEKTEVPVPTETKAETAPQEAAIPVVGEIAPVAEAPAPTEKKEETPAPAVSDASSNNEVAEQPIEEIIPIVPEPEQVTAPKESKEESAEAVENNVQIQAIPEIVSPEEQVASEFSPLAPTVGDVTVPSDQVSVDASNMTGPIFNEEINNNQQPAEQQTIPAVEDNNQVAATNNQETISETPNAIEPIETQEQDLSTVGLELTTFTKTTADIPKAILTTAKQNSNLRASRDTQEALLSAKRFFSTTGPKDVTEDQLIANGLLPPDEEVTEQKVEELMQKANELYNSGQVAEAQAVYEVISSMSKKLQEQTTAMKK